MKRIFAVVFVLIVLAAFTPLGCFADGEPIGLTCIDFQPSDNCSLSGNSITFTGSVILDLKGRSLTAEGITCDSGKNCSLTITDTTGTGVLDSVIFINGDISISGGTVCAAGTTDEATGLAYGIYAGNDLTISGGTVHATAAEGEDEQITGKLYGIYAGHNITISGGTVRAAGTIDEAADNHYGIYADGDINISGGTVEATGGACGIYSLSEGSSVTISGGTVKATGIGNDGIISSTVAISGGKVTATGDIGIGGNVINISDGEVTATGGFSAIYVEYIPNGSDIDIGISISISGGTVKATGGICATVFGTVSGSLTGGDITISGGTVVVTAEAYAGLPGIYSEIGDVAISGGEVTVNNVDINAGKDITIGGGEVTVNNGKIKAGEDITISGGQVTVNNGDISANNIFLGLAGPDDFIHAKGYGGTIQATTPLRVFGTKDMADEPLGTIQAGDTVDPYSINDKWLGPLKFSVSLDPQGGSGGTADITAIHSSPMPDITIPARTGYTFGGYFTETDGGGTQYYNADGSSAKNWTETEVDKLYAKWEKIPPKPLSDPSVTARLIPGSSFPYTGEPCRVGVEVRDGDKVLTEGVDYEITADSVLSAVEVGTYEVTVSADEKAVPETEGKAAKAVIGGDYTGSVTLTWRITPGNTPERSVIDFFRLHADCELPATGFSSLRPAVLPEQPKDLRYEPVQMHLMLPTLDREIELVTMPRQGNSWAAAWLGADAGILEGSALPGEGVSLIAAHNTLNETDYGPFALLGTLEVNDTVMVREESGALKLFRVYANELLEPDDMERLSALAGDDALVLLTCENESPAGTYLNRRAIFAR